MYALVLILGPKSISFNQMHTAVGAGAIIPDAGDKLLGEQDILFCFNNKVYDPFAISFSQFHTSIGDGAMILAAAFLI